MSRLGNRVRRLEGGANQDEVIVWMRFPDGMPEKKRKELAEAAARERGYEPPFKFEPDDWPTQEVTVMYIGPGAVLTALIHDIQRRNRQDG